MFLPARVQSRRRAFGCISAISVALLTPVYATVSAISARRTRLHVVVYNLNQTRIDSILYNISVEKISSFAEY
jgi:hypothetical protein